MLRKSDLSLAERLVVWLLVAFWRNMHALTAYRDDVHAKGLKIGTS